MKKLFFLILTLAIPVAIFIFLKLFGTNSFEVPILFSNGIPGCTIDSSEHTIPEFRYIGETEKNLSSEELSGFLVFAVLLESDLLEHSSKMLQLVRIQDAFFEIGSPMIVMLITKETAPLGNLRKLCDEAGLLQKNRCIAFLESQILMDYLKCGIALINDTTRNFNNLVLVDPNRNIRGIYQSTEMEQTDRLILELKILKQQRSQ